MWVVQSNVFCSRQHDQIVSRIIGRVAVPVMHYLVLAHLPPKEQTFGNQMRTRNAPAVCQGNQHPAVAPAYGQAVAKVGVVSTPQQWGLACLGQTTVMAAKEPLGRPTMI